MAESSRIVTTVSVVVAVACAAWAIYATKHAGEAGMGGSPPAMGAAAGGPAAGSPGGGRPGGPGAAAPVTVITAPVVSARVAQEISALGTARANEAVEITAKSSNLVTAVKFRDGQRVQRGDVLVELDSAQARADLAAAQAALSESVSLYNRSSELMSTQVLSKSQFEQLEATMKGNEAKVAAARARLEDTVIRAPFAGKIGLRRVSVGSLINPGTTITTLDDTSIIKVDFSVPENFLATLEEGQSVTAQTAAFQGRQFSGKVISVDSRVDPTTRSVTVRAAIPNTGNALKPGMFLDVRLAKDERDALLIPEEALVPEQSRQFVFVVADGKAAKREVRIGRREPGRVEVVAGLRADERVVVEGTQKIRDGSVVRDTPAAARDAGPQPAAAGAGAAVAPPASLKGGRGASS